MHFCTLFGMRVLTPAQADALRDRIQPMVEFIFRCRHRLETLGFDRDGAIYQANDKAYGAFHELRTTLERQSGRKPGS
jgi:hypothetical protein